jgi:hypothetical protein
VTAFAVSITLYFNVAKKSRAIKTREEELKKLAETKGSAVSLQALRTAAADPVESLRCE